MLRFAQADQVEKDEYYYVVKLPFIRDISKSQESGSEEPVAPRHRGNQNWDLDNSAC